MRECIDLIEELTFIKQKKALIIQKELELSKPILADVNQVARECNLNSVWFLFY